MADLDLNSLPQMSKWFSPRLLMLAAFRDVVAHVFGQFADQRTIQHLGDAIPPDGDLKKSFGQRYNYSNEAASGQPFWVDLVGDLGDASITAVKFISKLG